jgi:hypothetical protein
MRIPDEGDVMHHQSHMMLLDLARSRGEQVARNSRRPEVLAHWDLMSERSRWRRKRPATA